jgi:hypothetical protein
MTATTLLPSAVEASGRTPLAELSRFTRDMDGRILAKLEHPHSQTVLNKRWAAHDPVCATATAEERGLFSN